MLHPHHYISITNRGRLTLVAEPTVTRYVNVSTATNGPERSEKRRLCDDIFKLYRSPWMKFNAVTDVNEL